jgi:hypothetical protein
LTPEYIVVPSNGTIIISLIGAGLGLSNYPVPALSFASPSDAAGTFNISSLVLTVSLTLGTFTAGSPIEFSISGVSNPSLPQFKITSLIAVITTADNIVIGRSTEGTFPAIIVQRKRWVFMCGNAANGWSCVT